ncbi:MAG: cupredoxin family copper-binding protein [Candidatus Acidiferrales bacterium]
MKTMIVKLVGCAALLGVFAWLGASRISFFSHASGPAATEVKIDNYSFAPHDITVAAGTTVSWVNHDDVPHTVRSTDDAFKSKALDTDDKYSFQFDKPGTYEYFCSIHPKMTAKVIVK